MSGTLAVPTNYTGAVGNQLLSQLGADFTAITVYVNGREVTIGTLANRPAAGIAGRWYLATDVAGGTLYVDSGLAWVAAGAGAGSFAISPAIIGLTLSNDGVSPNTVLDIALGAAASDDAALSARVVMSLVAAYTKTTAAWAVGTGNGGLDAGAIGASTWYHVFLISRADTGVTDVLFSLSATAPTMPANYTNKRRLGSFKTNGASQIITFVQQGDYFRWLASVTDYNTAWANNNAFTITLASVPTGVNVEWLGEVILHIGGTAGSFLVSDLAANDEAPLPIGTTPPVAPGFTVSEGTANQSQSSGLTRIRTNTAAQVRGRFSAGDANSIPALVTMGYYDRRGQDS